MTTALVTGGAGFIGAALVKRLITEGYNIRVLDNMSRGTVRRLSSVRDNFEFIKGDIRDYATVDAAVKGVDMVFHLAYVNGTEYFYTKPDLVLDVGVKGMVNVIDACMKNSVGDLIVASSSEVYQTPPNIPTDESAPLVVPDILNPRYSYGGGKILTELMAINYGRSHFNRVVIFRPHNVYGPDMGWEHVLPQFVLRMREICAASDDKTVDFPIQGTGQESRSFIYIDDFTDGLMTVANKGQHLGIFHIGTQEEVTILDIAEQVGSFYRRKVNIIPGPLQKGGTLRRCPDITKLRGMDFEPKVLFRDGLSLLVEWYDSNAELAPKSGTKQ